DLLTLDKDTLEPPETRIKDCLSTRARIKELKDGDRTRTRRRAHIEALIDGEPPYDEEEMIDCGRGDDANINFRQAKGKVAAAVAPYYELAFGVPKAINLYLDYGDDPEKRFEWAEKICERYTETLWGWKAYRTNFRVSAYQRVVHGRGPVIWPRIRG